MVVGSAPVDRMKMMGMRVLVSENKQTVQHKKKHTCSHPSQAMSKREQIMPRQPTHTKLGIRGLGDITITSA